MDDRQAGRPVARCLSLHGRQDGRFVEIAFYASHSLLVPINLSDLGLWRMPRARERSCVEERARVLELAKPSRSAKDARMRPVLQCSRSRARKSHFCRPCLICGLLASMYTSMVGIAADTTFFSARARTLSKGAYRAESAALDDLSSKVGTFHADGAFKATSRSRLLASIQAGSVCASDTASAARGSATVGAFFTYASLRSASLPCALSDGLLSLLPVTLPASDGRPPSMRSLGPPVAGDGAIGGVLGIVAGAAASPGTKAAGGSPTSDVSAGGSPTSDASVGGSPTSDVSAVGSPSSDASVGGSP